MLYPATRSRPYLCHLAFSSASSCLYPVSTPFAGELPDTTLLGCSVTCFKNSRLRDPKSDCSLSSALLFSNSSSSFTIFSFVPITSSFRSRASSFFIPAISISMVKFLYCDIPATRSLKSSIFSPPALIALTSLSPNAIARDVTTGIPIIAKPAGPASPANTLLTAAPVPPASAFARPKLSTKG